MNSNFALWQFKVQETEETLTTKKSTICVEERRYSSPCDR